jgi:regulator of PEP synthase PpsR (kinase-PPPase family)
MYHIYVISDGTGKTAEGVVRAALTQFEDAPVEIVRRSHVRDANQLEEIVDEARKSAGFIVHTLVSQKMRTLILTEGRSAHVPTIDLMGPMLARLSELLATRPRSVPGLFTTFDPGYLQRIDAIDFTVRHDDGQNIDDLERAEIVLLGVSRTSKTPLSIYLGYRGWKVANVPLILGVEPPSQIFNLPRKGAVGLVIKPERLAELRQVRVNHMGTGSLGYADLDYIRQEMAYAYEIFEQRRDWPLVDVTTKPIEETAAEVVALLGHTWKGFGDIEAG